MVKNALNRSNSRILKSGIPQEKKCSYKLEKHKRWFVSFWLVEVKNALGHLNCRILEPAIFQLKIDESTWFLAGRYRFKKPERWYVGFWFFMGKNAVDQSDCRLHKSAMSQEWLD